MREDTTPPPDDDSGFNRRWPPPGSPARTALIYALLGGVWILLSDAAVFWFSRDPATIETLQNLKGIFYVAVTTLLVYFLARRAVASAEERALKTRLKQTRNLMESVLTHLGEVVVEVDPRTRVIRNCNPSAADVFGYSPADLIGQSAEKLHLDREHYHRFRDLADPSLRDKAVFRVRFPLRHRDGRRIETEITAFMPDPGSAGDIGLISIVRDLTETIHARDRLEESERKYRLLAENTVDVIWSMDLEGVITYVNPAVKSLIGLPPEKVVGTNVRDYCTSKSLSQLEAFIREGVKKGAENSETVLVTEILDAEGRVIPVESHGKILFDPLGRPIGGQAVNRDIRERLALEAQLRQAQKMESIGTLASGIAHEVNNPIMIISGYSQMIAHREGTDDKTRDLAEKIDGETRRIQKIVDNLLGFARIDHHEAVTTFHMRSVFNDALGLVQASLRHDEILVEVPPGNSRTPGVEGHPHQLQQVFLNLLTNARDALNRKFPDTDPEKRILVSTGTVCHDHAIWARLTIEDRGCGLTREAENRLFDPFFTTKPKGKGTGLGLWISYGIIEEHQGRLSMETREGRFTRFHVDLPALPNADQEPG